MWVSWEQRLEVLLLISLLGLRVCLGHGEESGSCPFSSPEPHEPHQHHHCDHDHHDHEHHHHHHQQHHHHEHNMGLLENKLAEELAEEEDLKVYGFGSHHGHLDHDHHHHHHHHDHPDSELSRLGLWIQALGCSLLVSMASLICLILLPVIFLQGKPSKAVVDSLAAFGAGAMLGDAFLHQLPHAFGGGHSHSHDNHVDHTHDHFHQLENAHSHSHSLKDLSVGLSILSGIVLFLLVEKLVRYVEANSGNEVKAWGHGHHHHHQKSSKKSDDDDSQKLQSVDEKNGDVTEKLLKEEVLDGVSGNQSNEENRAQNESLIRRRTTTTVASDDDKPGFDAANVSTNKLTQSTEKELPSSPSNLVFGYLNLFSDGVHNFTDGMALGSAFLLNGAVGGWSRTLFLLAHEIPQEVGDFGILVRSGFSVSKALFFNFLSALVALVGTALALLIGRDPGHSSLIEGFTAGGFIYIAVAGVLPEMNSGSSTFKSTAIQLTSLILGMAVALCISLVE